MDKVKNVSRRNFLKFAGITGGGLILGSVVPAWAPALAAGSSTDSRLNLFISIDTDNTVNIVCHRSEMGQGIRTGLPQVAADELNADWKTVNVIQGLADERYGSQNTDGSRSIRHFYKVMREMGASARTMLEQAAANRWGVPLEQVYAENSRVLSRSGNRSLSFGELAVEAAKLDTPDAKSLTYKSPKDFKFIGKEVTSIDLPDVLAGTTTFGQDMHLPDMLYASIQRAPVVGDTVNTFDKDAAMKVKGVVDVWQMPNTQPIPAVFNAMPGVAVLANSTWAAQEGRKQLNIKWNGGVNKSYDSDTYLAQLKKSVAEKGKSSRQQGDAYAAAKTAKSSLNASYTMPYLVHAPMEPPAATAIVREGSCEVWACTQTPQSTQRAVARALGIEKDKVTVHVTLLGGGFGRKSKPDFSVEAALLSRHSGKPVKVVWSREDDIQHGYYHAVSAQHFEASFNDKEQVTGWIQRTAFPSMGWTFNGQSDEPGDNELSLGFSDMPFDIDNFSCEKHKATGHIRLGWVRSVSNIHHGYALGAFVDEVAVKSKVSTQKMWHTLIGSDRMIDPSTDTFNYANYGESLEDFPIDTKRLKYTLDKVVSESGADKPVAENEGWGISVHRSFVSYVAVAMKVKVENGKVQVLEAHSAIDAGLVVNPDRVKAQLEGAVIFGLSLALMGEISVKDGAVVQSNFHDYPMLRIHQCPKITAHIVKSDAAPGGVGEPGVPPVAASLVNAIYHASGKRIRDLPVSKHLQV